MREHFCTPGGFTYSAVALSENHVKQAQLYYPLEDWSHCV